MKTLYVFRGPCGAGKTRLRKYIDMNLEPYVIDMFDAPRGISVKERSQWLFDLIDKADNNITIFLEGIFAPNSPSYIALQSYCLNNGIELVSITINRSLARILQDIPENETDRIKFAKEYHHKFQ